MVIRSPRVVLPDGVRPAAIHVRGGRIAAVLPYGDIGDDARRGGDARVVDSNDVVMPGIVDTHVHVNDPGRSEWEGFQTAGAAAAAGGVTTIVDMPLNSVPATTTVDALERKRAAARAAFVNVAYWGGVVPGNPADLEPLARAGVRGFKCFLSPSGVDEFPHVTEADLRMALPVLARLGLPLLVHAELPAALLAPATDASPRAYSTWLASRPARAEVDAIALLIALCREFRTPVHIVHLAAREALPLLRSARAEGLPLTVETCPHYLTFAAESIQDSATLFKCAPPIRDAANRDALWAALADRTIDLIASDHSPCPPGLKGDGDFLRAWGGIASLELGLAAVWTGASDRGMRIERVAEWLCAAPARLAGFTDRGAIAPGLRADFVLWDPDAAFTVQAERLHHRHKVTPYDGMRLRGRVRETYVGGEVVYRGG